jgi:hypothetical protein
MSRLYIVSIGYLHLGTESKEQALNLLDMKILKNEYIGGEYIYYPEKGEKIKIETIDSSSLRAPTKEEVENKELESAKSSEQWAKKQAENLRKEVEELKCQIKVLTKSESSDPL